MSIQISRSRGLSSAGGGGLDAPGMRGCGIRQQYSSKKLLLTSTTLVDCPCKACHRLPSRCWRALRSDRLSSYPPKRDALAHLDQLEAEKALKNGAFKRRRMFFLAHFMRISLVWGAAGP